MAQKALTETCDIPEFGDQFATTFDLLLTDNRVSAKAGRGCPVAYGVSGVMLDHGQWSHGTTAATLADLLAARAGESPARDGHVVPG